MKDKGKFKLIWIALLVVIPIYLIFTIGEKYIGGDNRIITFGYICRSEEEKSFSDLYNDEIVNSFIKTNNTKIRVIKGVYEEVMKQKDSIDVFIDYPVRSSKKYKLDIFHKTRYVLYTKSEYKKKDFKHSSRIALFKKDSIFLKDFIMDYYSNDYIYVRSIEEGFSLLNAGKVDGFISEEDDLIMKNPSKKDIVKVNIFGNYAYYKTISVFSNSSYVKEKVERFINLLTARKAMAIEEKAESRLIWSQINFTEEEKKYIQNKRVIKLGGNFKENAPLAYMENGSVRGVIGEYISLLSRGTGLNVNYVNIEDDNEAYRNLEDGLIDIDVMVPVNHEGIKNSVESNYYFESIVGIFTLKGNRNKGVEKILKDYNLSGGDTGIKIDEIKGEYQFIKGDSIKDYYQKLKSGEIDYFIHSYSILKNYNNQNSMRDLIFYGILDRKERLAMVALNENKVLIDILNKMFQYVDFNKVQYRWEIESAGIAYKGNYKKYAYLLLGIIVFLLPYILILKIEMEKIKKIDKELQKTKSSLQEALNIKSAFLANMSHEMKTPLTAVLGFNKLLQKKETDTKKLELIQNVGVAAENLLEFINSVLDLSKLESGKVELKVKRVNLYNMADEIEKISLGLKRNNDVEFCFIITEQAPKYFMGDEVWLKEIILNLLNNAFKFTEKGCVQLYISSMNDDLIIEVRDTGIGMKNFENEREKIFKRYERLDLNENRDKKGSGLGLAIVKEVVELMDGRISVKSTYKIGTTFRMVIPIRKRLELPGMNRTNKRM